MPVIRAPDTSPPEPHGAGMPVSRTPDAPLPEPRGAGMPVNQTLALGPRSAGSAATGAGNSLRSLQSLGSINVLFGYTRGGDQEKDQ